jgi:hypothetical protein
MASGVEPGEVEAVMANGPFDLGYEFVNGEERWTSIGHTHQVRVRSRKAAGRGIHQAKGW